MSFSSDFNHPTGFLECFYFLCSYFFRLCSSCLSLILWCCIFFLSASSFFFSNWTLSLISSFLSFSWSYFFSLRFSFFIFIFSLRSSFFIFIFWCNFFYFLVSWCFFLWWTFFFKWCFGFFLWCFGFFLWCFGFFLWCFGFLWCFFLWCLGLWCFDFLWCLSLSCFDFLRCFLSFFLSKMFYLTSSSVISSKCVLPIADISSYWCGSKGSSTSGCSSLLAFELRPMSLLAPSSISCHGVKPVASAV